MSARRESAAVARAGAGATSCGRARRAGRGADTETRVMRRSVSVLCWSAAYTSRGVACCGLVSEDRAMTTDDARSPWTLATRTERMNPSAIREILKLTELPGI